jgi:hypothetical protein
MLSSLSGSTNTYVDCALLLYQQLSECISQDDGWKKGEKKSVPMISNAAECY